MLHGGQFSAHTPTGNLKNPFFLGPLVLLQACSRPSIAVLRAVSLASGLLALAVNWLLSRWVFDRRTALVSTLALAVLPINIAYSRIAWDASQSLLATLPVLYFSLAAVRFPARQDRLTAVAIVSLLAAIMVHPTNIFAGAALVAALAARWRKLWFWNDLGFKKAPAAPPWTENTNNTFAPPDNLANLQALGRLSLGCLDAGDLGDISDQDAGRHLCRRSAGKPLQAKQPATVARFHHALCRTFLRRIGLPIRFGRTFLVAVAGLGRPRPRQRRRGAALGPAAGGRMDPLAETGEKIADRSDCRCGRESSNRRGICRSRPGGRMGAGIGRLPRACRHVRHDPRSGPICNMPGRTGRADGRSRGDSLVGKISCGMHSSLDRRPGTGLVHAGRLPATLFPLHRADRRASAPDISHSGRRTQTCGPGLHPQTPRRRGCVDRGRRVLELLAAAIPGHGRKRGECNPD